MACSILAICLRSSGPSCMDGTSRGSSSWNMLRFLFVTGFMYTDNKAPKEVRSQAQSLLVFFTQGIGMFFGYKIAGAKFDAVKESSDSLSAAITSPSFGFWESFGKMFVAEKPDAPSALVEKAMADWKDFWMFPSMMALIVAGIFLVTFFDQSSTKKEAEEEA